MLQGAYWHHRYLDSSEIFYPDYYQKEMGRMLSEAIQAGDFDIVLTPYALFCTHLEVDIPVIAFSDVTFPLFKEYFPNKDAHYHQIAMETEQKCLKKVDAMLYASEWAKESAIRNYGIDREKLHIAEFGANIPFPQYTPTEVSDNSVCNLLFVGRNWEKKGGSKVLEAYKILKRKQIKCTLTIIGSSPNEDVSDNEITIIPWLDKSKKEDLKRYELLLRNSYFMVLPTTFDAFGIVFCEASAYGIPSLATNVGGVGQPIIEGKNGFLLPADATAEDYAYKIESIWNCKHHYARLRINARQEFETRLNWEKWYNTFSSVAENLITMKKEQRAEEVTQTSSFFLPVYAINLPHRVDRRKHIKEQFAGKPEFELTIMEAVQHEMGTIGLWESIVQVIRCAQMNKEDIIIICEDDHVFTPEYDKNIFFSQISEAYRQNVDLVMGGIGGFGDAVFVGGGEILGRLVLFHSVLGGLFFFVSTDTRLSISRRRYC